MVISSRQWSKSPPLCWFREDLSVPSCALIRQGDEHSKMEEWDQAIECFEAAIETAEQRRDRHTKGSALIHLAEVHRVCNNWDKSLGRYKEAISLFRSLGDDHNWAVACRMAAMLCHCLSQSGQALAWCEEALEILTRSWQRQKGLDNRSRAAQYKAWCDDIQMRVEEVQNSYQGVFPKEDAPQSHHPGEEVPPQAGEKEPPSKQHEEEMPPVEAPSRPGSYEVEVAPDLPDPVERPALRGGWPFTNLAVVWSAGIIVIAITAAVLLPEDWWVGIVAFAATLVSCTASTVALVRVGIRLRVGPAQQGVIIRGGVATVVPPGRSARLLERFYSITPAREIGYSFQAHFLDSGTRQRKIEQRVVVRYHIKNPVVATEWHLANRADGQAPQESLRAFIERQISAEVRNVFERIPAADAQQRLARPGQLAAELRQELVTRHQGHGIETADVQLGFCRIREC